MSTSLGIDPSELNTNNSNNEPTTSYPAQRRQAAFDLAELIYDIFHNSLSNATIEANLRKDKEND